MKLVYHLGYPRTGTTLLQKHLFKSHSEINYLGPKYYDGDDSHLIKHTDINELQKIYIKNSDKKDSYFNDLKKTINLDLFSEKKLNIFSSEKYLSFRKYREHEGLIALKELLEKNFDLQLKIFYVVRNQYDLLKSHYHHGYGYFSNFFKYKNFSDLVKKIEKKQFDENSNIYHFLKAYDFNFMYEKIKLNFKDSETKIFSFNDLKHNKEYYFKQISEFLDINSAETDSLIKDHVENATSLMGDKNLLQSRSQYFISNNQLYKKIKFLIPAKIKYNINKFLLIKKLITSKENDEMRLIVDNYYLKSNQDFLRKTGVKIL